MPKMKIVARFLKGQSFKLMGLDVDSKTILNALKVLYLLCYCFVFYSEMITIIKNWRIDEYTHYHIMNSYNCLKNYCIVLLIIPSLITKYPEIILSYKYVNSSSLNLKESYAF